METIHRELWKVYGSFFGNVIKKNNRYRSWFKDVEFEEGYLWIYVIVDGRMEGKKKKEEEMMSQKLFYFFKNPKIF